MRFAHGIALGAVLGLGAGMIVAAHATVPEPTRLKVTTAASHPHRDIWCDNAKRPTVVQWNGNFYPADYATVKAICAGH